MNVPLEAHCVDKCHTLTLAERLMLAELDDEFATLLVNYFIIVQLFSVIGCSIYLNSGESVARENKNNCRSSVDQTASTMSCHQWHAKFVKYVMGKMSGKLAQKKYYSVLESRLNGI